MQLNMNTTIPGSRDGMKVETFQKGETYAFNTPHEIELAQAFLEMGVAEEAKQPEEEQRPDQKPEQKPGPDANKGQKQPETKGGEQK